MIAIIFEVTPADGRRDAYLDIAARLRGELEQIDGFISVERFQSITNPGKMLSISFFRDEQAVQQWRNLSVHRAAQQAGRGGIFADYRLRVAQVLRDYGLNDRAQAPDDSRAVHHDARSES
ncbi:antibiotic biosynthesis monooxygenase [Ferrovibrio sp.]|uniref:antibiotic biosynthesis monooxygenase family protein n=1 Tax=Ferrovibrio sp. TaxID=1917215 RepID=UPI0025BF3A56|nr:antibiotic biosynthesis monooxygenase [Ferrovibrio sp.]MBX3453529.1 antibiotic biosynthesis monooxygenase [Ferrovibrio sp.]